MSDSPFDDNLDRDLVALFATKTPALGWEDRLTESLRPRMRRPASPWTFPLAVAASFLLFMGVGAIAFRAMEEQPAMVRSVATKAHPNEMKKTPNLFSHLKSRSWFDSFFDSHDEPGPNYFEELMAGTMATGTNKADPFATTDADPTAKKQSEDANYKQQEADGDINYNLDRKSDVSIPKFVSPNDVAGVQETPPMNLPALSGLEGRIAEGNLARPSVSIFDYSSSMDGSGVPKTPVAPQPGKDKAEESSGWTMMSPATSFLGRSGSTSRKGNDAGKDVYYFDPAKVEKILDEINILPPSKKPADGQPVAPETPAPTRPAPVLALQDKDKKEKQPDDQAPATPAQNRKIIRTGDIEFEIDSFDNATAGVQGLINATKGGFVATINSQKMPNGKVQGSVVVRMPPDLLDGFLLDLRKLFAKTGELKSQKLGSLDVSKQYADIESRLRAARTMEQRLLDIIKSGKGEIKDLLMAEKELGVWRTKIEEMEGEIRYLSNQVGLATLTIHLIEKEIQSPALVVVSETVTMRLEVEDVEKSVQTALDLAKKHQGRVIQSDVKQPALGQYEAILIIEAAPDQADALREQLKRLGEITQFDAQKNRRSEEGKGPPIDSKVRTNDVRFHVQMYNNAKIQPRETLNMQLATRDVVGVYQKIREAVQNAKGQIHVGQLQEKDRLNISAQLDFDLATTEAKVIEKLALDLGKVLWRNVTQAPASTTVSDRKVGYRLVLRNIAALPAREKLTVGVEVADVRAAVADLLTVADTAGATIGSNTFDQLGNGQSGARLTIDVPSVNRKAIFDSLRKAGKIHREQIVLNADAPELGQTRFDVVLSNEGPIVPRDDGFWPQIRTGLYYSFRILSFSVMFLILGFCVVLPWAILLWAGYRIYRRLKSS